MFKKILIIFIGLVLLLPLTTNADSFEKNAAYTVCFTPGADCTAEIVDAVNNAVNSIWVQAYSFTSRPIAKALVTAKQRGVNVQIVMDKSVLDRPAGAWNFVRNGIPVWIDKQPAIAHNKVMILDQTRVITGSFNFTYSAQNKNAENVLIIDDAGLAKQYLANWQKRQSVSDPLVLSSIPDQKTNWLQELWRWLERLFGKL